MNCNSILILLKKLANDIGHRVSIRYKCKLIFSLDINTLSYIRVVSDFDAKKET